MTTNTAKSTRLLLPTSLRALIIAASYWALSLSLTVLSGSVAAIIGCVSACYLVDLRLNKAPLNQLRSLPLIGLAIGFALLGFALAVTITDANIVSTLFSPMLAFNAGESIKWFCLSASITLSLRVLAHRTSFGAVLEIVFVASAFIITLAAHRNGMIHRPFFIGDFALVRESIPPLFFWVLAALLYWRCLPCSWPRTISAACPIILRFWACCA